MTYYDETAFFKAWRTGVALAGERYFGNGTHSPATTSSMWDLAPDLERINHDIGVLSRKEATFLAALVSFYDPPAGADLQRQVDARALSEIAASLDHTRRQVLADLFITYPGWRR
ncbi:hypothetical protein VXE65_19070 [Mycolicibacterium conceptionense]|uniref:hypothetical protein n=1 Tax=Mycolicibacterium conceptionense TaxID=451644 RepID=UPI0032048F18